VKYNVIAADTRFVGNKTLHNHPVQRWLWNLLYT